MYMEENYINKTYNGKKNTNILFLGTGAADWLNIEHSDTNREPNDKYRHLSSILINNQILVDCGPTTLNSLSKYNIDNNSITDILITHTHEDHLSPDVLAELARLKCKDNPIKLWAHVGAFKRIPKINGLYFCPLKIGRSFHIGDITVKPLAANHVVKETNEKPLHYLFSNEGRQWLYASDGAWLLKSTWTELSKSKLDIIIFDATVGPIDDDPRIFEHNNLTMIRLMLGVFRKCRVIDSKSTILLTHMSRVLYDNCEEIEKNLENIGIISAYDGLNIKF